MLKFIIIFLLVGYLVMKIVGYFVRSIFGQTMEQLRRDAQQQQQRQYKKPNDGNVHIDYIPNSGDVKRKDNFRDGDYVDYEEVK